MTDATQPQTVYMVRDGIDLKQVTLDEYCDAFNRGEPTFVAYPQLAESEEPFDVSDWQPVGYTSDIPEAFRRQP